MNGDEPDPPLVFDATCLSHFCRAERFDVLRDLLLGSTCLTTHVAREEIRQGMGNSRRTRVCTRLHASARPWTAGYEPFFIFAMKTWDSALGSSFVLCRWNVIGGMDRYPADAYRSRVLPKDVNSW
ncbi:hypothetical protein AB0L53_38105 [Nonomuraea sp. NPDC052129]|uniref:hypothetical protein n=1 Tax=Nonomuraea sp. NPDC052129 TaxID=3154651 RepID=UPI003420DAC2